MADASSGVCDGSNGAEPISLTQVFEPIGYNVQHAADTGVASLARKGTPISRVMGLLLLKAAEAIVHAAVSVVADVCDIYLCSLSLFCMEQMHTPSRCL